MIWYYWRILACCFVFPCIVLSSLLSLAFPFVAFCSLPFGAVPLLHRLASFAYFGSLLVWLLLGIKALQFLWIRLHIFNLAELSFINETSRTRFRDILTHDFCTLQGSYLTKSVLPLPAVLSALVTDYAFEENSHGLEKGD